MATHISLLRAVEAFAAVLVGLCLAMLAQLTSDARRAHPIGGKSTGSG